jgi:hypothetical protein
MSNKIFLPCIYYLLVKSFNYIILYQILIYFNMNTTEFIETQLNLIEIEKNAEIDESK